MVSCDFHRVTEIFDKIDAGPLESLKKPNVSWEQEFIKSVISISEVRGSFGKCIIYYF